MTREIPLLHITVINLHSSRNIGDAALLEMTLVLLQDAFPQCHITLMMNDPDYSYAERDPAHVTVTPSLSACIGAHDPGASLLAQALALTGILLCGLLAALWYRLTRRLPRKLPAGWGTLLAAYMQADWVASCPGNIFASTGRVGKTLIIAALTVAYPILLGKPLYVLPQSIGPFRGEWARRLTGALYRRARLVFVREPVAFREAQAMRLPKDRLRLVPDVAFALSPASPEEAQARLVQLGLGAGPWLGVTVINRLLSYVGAETWDRYEAALAAALTQFMQERRGWVIFFPQVTGPSSREDDREAAKRVLALMGNPAGAVILDEVFPPALLKALCGQMDVFVATRMHSAIFALGMGVPTLMIEYLSKTRGLAEMLNLEAWRLELAQVDAERLWHTLDQLWRERTTQRAQLAARLPAFCATVKTVGQALAEDFYGR